MKRLRACPVSSKGRHVKPLFIALAGITMLALSACNTIEGAGKDVKAAGQAVESAAKDAKPK